MKAVVFREAESADLGTLLELMPLYCEADHLPYEADRAEAAIRMLLSEPQYGRIWMIEGTADERAIGYLALTFGFSLEFGGREAFVDELFVRDEFRGAGIGSEAIRHAITECRQDGLAAIRLEVTPANSRAMKLYTSLGFQDYGRSLLAFPLGSARTAWANQAIPGNKPSSLR